MTTKKVFQKSFNAVVLPGWKIVFIYYSLVLSASVIVVEQFSEKSKMQITEQKRKNLEKEFKIQNSPLTDRFENNEDIRTIYNLFAIILISLLTNTIINDYSKTGELNLGLRLVVAGFNKLDLVILMWLSFNILALVAYYSFTIWATIRASLKPRTATFWDKIWITTLILYYAFSFYYLKKLVAFFEFAPCSAAVLYLEEIRLLMKQYAFIRSNAYECTTYKAHSEKALILPNITKFLYFIFAPTLIYRDEYPRTLYIRWKFAVCNFLEVLGLIYLLSLVVERFLVPPFEEICLRKYSLSEVIIPVIGNSFPGVLFLLCGFYSVLHSSQNFFAELLRFGDRMFYREWWTSRSLSEYYRTWNVVVHDWLFTYIYKDMYEVVAPKKKIVAKLTVFVISAIVHEWIITNVLNLFFPIQFTEFFIMGAVLALLNILDLPLGNLVVWYCIVIGSGIQVNLYTLEFFARKNCPLSESDSFFKPRFITCGCIE